MSNPFEILILILIASVAVTAFTNRKVNAQRRKQLELLERIAEALEKRG